MLTRTETQIDTIEVAAVERPKFSVRLQSEAGKDSSRRSAIPAPGITLDDLNTPRLRPWNCTYLACGCKAKQAKTQAKRAAIPVSAKGRRIVMLTRTETQIDTIEADSSALATCRPQAASSTLQAPGPSLQASSFGPAERK